MAEDEELHQLISRGESQKLEFKAALPPSDHLGRLISAFANSSGETILLGVRDDGTVSGVSRLDTENTLRKAVDGLQPSPEAFPTFYNISLKGHVARIDVAADPRGPIIARGWGVHSDQWCSSSHGGRCD